MAARLLVALAVPAVLAMPSALGACAAAGDGEAARTATARPAEAIVEPGGPAGVAEPDGRAASARSSPATMPTAAASATPEGLVSARVTEPGCCPLPFWSADGRTVLFWYRPEGGEAGVYGVPIGGGLPGRVADAPSGVHLGGRFTTLREGGEIVLSRSDDGRTWRFATGGAGLVLSADGTEVAWVETLGESVPGRAPPPRVHWRASLEPGAEGPIASPEPARVDVPPAYALSDWTASGAWLLARVDRRRADLTALIRFDPDTGEQTPLLDGQRLRTFRVSPGRSWLAVTRTFEDEPADNGLYLVATDGTAPPRRLDLIGGYQWRDDGRLLVVPMQPGARSMSLWQVDAASGAAERLVDPARTRLRIAGGEWSAAPGGAHLAFRSADDGAVWVMTLP